MYVRLRDIKSLLWVSNVGVVEGFVLISLQEDSVQL